MMFEVIERLQGAADPKIGSFCRYVLETLNQKHPGDDEQAALVQLFIRWVSASYLEDKEAQEK